MIRRSEIRPLLTMGLLAVGFTTTALEAITFYEAMQLSRKFPAQVAEFEQKYGKFKQKPQIEFRPLPYGKGGTVQRGNVVVDNSLLNTLLFQPDRKRSVVHELGHLVTHQIIHEINPKWIWVLNGKAYVASEDFVEQYIAISEGIAEFIAVQNGVKLNIDYQTHYAFVEPVLEKLGVRRGVETLLLNPPTREELKNPLAYYSIIGLRQ